MVECVAHNDKVVGSSPTLLKLQNKKRSITQFGSVPDLGSGSHRFKSYYSDFWVISLMKTYYNVG